jgi:hypothetical protein
MKRLICILGIVLALSSCSRKPILEGEVNFATYEPEPGDVRTIYSDKAPENFKPDPAHPYAQFWDSNPKVKLFDGYAELFYTVHRGESKEFTFVHVIPSERLHFLRWRFPQKY